MSIINTNMLALKSQGHLSRSQSALSASIQRLSSGLRINSAKNDAAGLAIANRMEAGLRANVAVSRGVSDGISLVQTAEGGLNSLNDLLQRSRQLAVQAANGTLNETDRFSLNNEYLALRAEIDRVANETEAFGKYPLAPTTLPEPAPEAPPAPAPDDSMGETDSLEDLFGTNGTTLSGQLSGIKPVAYIPAGVTNVDILVDAIGIDDDIQIFTRDGKHLVGTPLGDYTWTINGVTQASDLKTRLFDIGQTMGFTADAVYDDTNLLHLEPDPTDVYSTAPGAGTTGTYEDMTFTYSGDGDRFDSDTNATDGMTDAVHAKERLHIDKVTEPLLLVVTGSGSFNITANWAPVPKAPKPPAPPTPAQPPQGPRGTEIDIVTSASYGQDIQKITVAPTPADHAALGLDGVALNSAENAGQAMTALSAALNKVDEYRGQYGGLTNRFESIIDGLSSQSANLALAQSRIQDTDYAAETSAMLKAKILQDAGAAVLAQANQVPQSVLSLLEGIG